MVKELNNLSKGSLLGKRIRDLGRLQDIAKRHLKIWEQFIIYRTKKDSTAHTQRKGTPKKLSKLHVLTDRIKFWTKKLNNEK